MIRIEKKRSMAEKARFNQAIQEMEGLTEIVVHELQSAITRAANDMFAVRSGDQSKQLAFLGLPQQSANVRIESSTHPFPTVAELVQAQQLRRDSKEASDILDMLELQHQFIDAANQIIEDEFAAFQHNMRVEK